MNTLLLGVLLILLPLTLGLPECFLDCEVAEMGLESIQGHHTSDDCRCYQVCNADNYTENAIKVLDAYKNVPPTHKKAIYIRRDCKDAVMASGEFNHIDELIEKLWAPDGPMTLKTKEQPAAKSVSAPKDWILLHANFHCPIVKQSEQIRRALRNYRLKATGGRALFFHRDCGKVRWASSKNTPEEAAEEVIKKLKLSNQSLDEWFLYDWNREGTCSPLTHRYRQEIRDFTPAQRQLWIEAMNESYRRGLYTGHGPFHGQSLMYNWAHGTPGFAPWHKLSILQIEDSLRGLGPKYQCLTAPYWAWPKDCDNPMKNDGIFTKELLGSITGILEQGNCGEHEDGCCVKDGAFSHWKDVKGECIKRNFVDLPIDRVGIPDTHVLMDLLVRYHNFGYISYGKTIATFGVVSVVLDQCLEECGDDADISGKCSDTCHGLISTKKFRGFMGDLELSHSRVHFSVGGHMYSSYSPADPLFQLNHGFVEKVYERWQKCQGFTSLADFWVTLEDHYADAYLVPGPYGFLDRQPGYLFTHTESSVGRDMMYTSYSYAVDQWEIDQNLNSTCPGWKKSEAFEFQLKEKRRIHSQLLTQKEPFLDDKMELVKKSDDGLSILLQHHEKKRRSRRSRTFIL